MAEQLQDELLLGRIAIASGLITREQLDECLAAQARAPAPVPLGRLLVQRALITEEQLQAMLVLQSARLTRVGTETKKPLKESLFGRIILRKGWMTEEQMNECLRIQEQCEAAGKARQLGEIMVEKGYLTVAQVKELLAEQNKSILCCERCGQRYNVTGYEPGRLLKCVKCDSPLVVPKHVPGPAVAATLRSDGTAVDNLIGQMLGGCKVLQRLGQGGMATIYKGIHIGLNKIVAIKVLPSSSAQNDQMIEQFFHEARAAAKLEHPNIVQVFNVGTERGVSFIIMQFIEGNSVAELLRMQNGPLEIETALKIVRGAARGLGAAHNAGIIHRDVKPDNIMVTTRDEVKVTDFGLAQGLSAMAAAQGKTLLAGTPHFMSPEHWSGKNVDGRSDIYSLGVTLYKMLTGVYPFDGNTPQILMKQHLRDKPRSPKSLNPNVSDGLNAIVGMMMAKDPVLRYQNMDELLADFDRLDGGEDPLALANFGKMVRCSFCSTANPATRRKCSFCGEYLLTKSTEVLLIEGEFQCPQCRAILTDGTTQCPSCGTPQTATTAAELPPAQRGPEQNTGAAASVGSSAAVVPVVPPPTVPRAQVEKPSQPARRVGTKALVAAGAVCCILLIGILVSRYGDQPRENQQMRQEAATSETENRHELPLPPEHESLTIKTEDTLAAKRKIYEDAIAFADANPDAYDIAIETLSSAMTLLEGTEWQAKIAARVQALQDERERKAEEKYLVTAEKLQKAMDERDFQTAKDLSFKLPSSLAQTKAAVKLAALKEQLHAWIKECAEEDSRKARAAFQAGYYGSALSLYQQLQAYAPPELERDVEHGIDACEQKIAAEGPACLKRMGEELPALSTKLRRLVQKGQPDIALEKCVAFANSPDCDIARAYAPTDAICVQLDNLLADLRQATKVLNRVIEHFAAMMGKETTVNLRTGDRSGIIVAAEKNSIKLKKGESIITFGIHTLASKALEAIVIEDRTEESYQALVGYYLAAGKVKDATRICESAQREGIDMTYWKTRLASLAERK